MAKDFTGKELNVGDEIVFMSIGYRALNKGKILTIAPKMVSIEYLHRHGKINTCKQFHGQVVKL